ncbi:MAG: formylglycine-generating enzyme family protein [bacterium]|nr:formylglycine-generating enzyme family protein [bacterium]
MKTTWIPRAGVIMTVLLLGSTLAQAQGTQLLVSNVQAQQRPFTATWDVTYDLETVGDIAVTVSLYLSTDSGASYPNLCGTVSGDVGAGVLPGIGKSIVWDAGADFPGLSSATCRLRVTADDGQSDVPAGFVAIGPGTFMMGSPTTEPGWSSDETQHQVTLTRGFSMQATEVTNQQYRDLVQWAYDNGYVTATSASVRDALDGSTQELLNLGGYGCEISFVGGTFTVDVGKANHPVLDVNWYGSVAYCDWLSLQQGLPRAYNHSTWQCNAGNPYTATGYRLPTEAEWEYACRAGTQTPFNTGSCLDAGTEANYDGCSFYTGCPTGPYVGWTVPVGSYPANTFGLYDMHGNLWEWCNDWYGTYGGTVTDPVGAGAGDYRVVRGGDWSNAAQGCRSACRGSSDPDVSRDDFGIRPVRSTS